MYSYLLLLLISLLLLSLLFLSLVFYFDTCLCVILGLSRRWRWSLAREHTRIYTCVYIHVYIQYYSIISCTIASCVYIYIYIIVCIIYIYKLCIHMYMYIHIHISISLSLSLYIYICVCVYTRKATCGAQISGIFYDEKVRFAQARRSIFLKYAVLLTGNTTFQNKRSAQAIYMFSSLCVVSLWRNNTFSMHVLTRKYQWVTENRG